MKIKILGIAQDGGIPHLRCNCNNCKNLTHYVSSIALIGEKTLVIDATPDITRQFRMLSNVDAMLITHLHLGHYIGILQLGKEVASTNLFPIYVTEKVAKFIRTNKPFNYLIERKNINLNLIYPGSTFYFKDIEILPFEVNHRNEDGNTIGLLINKKLLYIPDIDYLYPEIISRINSSETVFLDATFYDKNELSRQKNVPHPSIIDTMRIFGRPTNKFYFIHLNHTNPVLNKSSREYNNIIQNGYQLAYEGLEIEI